MALSAGELAVARKAMKENRQYDEDSKMPIIFPLFAFAPLSLTAFDNWHKGNPTCLYVLGFLVCVIWPFALFARSRRMQRLKSRYVDNSVLLEKLKAEGCPELFFEKRALLWRVDALLSRKRLA